MRWMGLLCLLLICQSAVCQQGDNPFDIRTPEGSKEITRSEVIQKADTDLDKPRVSNNPFDINIKSLDGGPVDISPSAEETSSSDLQVVTPTPRKAKAPNRLLLAILLLLAVVLTTIGITLDRSRYQHMLQTLISNSQLKALVRSGRQMANAQNIMMYASFWISSSVFLYLFMESHGYVFRWWMIPLGLLLIYVGRHIALSIFSQTFPLGVTAAVHNVGIGINNMLLSIPLIIAAVGLLFGTASMHSIFLYFGLIALVLMYAVRQVRGVGAAIEMRGFNPVYFFIYLCAFEIAPILVVLRLLR